MNDNNAESETRAVECPAAKDPAVRLFILAAMFIGFSIYTIYDHYYLGNYPRPEPHSLNPYLKYLFNHYLPWILTPIGLIALVWGIMFLRRVLVADEQAIGYKGKSKVAWSEIKSLDASRLESKGILVLCYDEGKRMKLDSWKLQNFRELVRFIESHIPQERSAQIKRG